MFNSISFNSSQFNSIFYIGLLVLKPFTDWRDNDVKNPSAYTLEGKIVSNWRPDGKHTNIDWRPDEQ